MNSLACQTFEQNKSNINFGTKGVSHCRLRCRTNDVRKQPTIFVARAKNTGYFEYLENLPY